MKLTEKQKEVLKLMREGWELGRSRWMGSSLTGRISLQKNGIGKGGECKDVHGNTFYFLERKKLIEYTPQTGRSMMIYELTELGKTFKL